MMQEGLLCADLVTSSQSQGQWKWCKMLEVNDAYYYGRYEKMKKRLHVMSNIKVFATQDSQPASWTQFITQIHIHGSKMQTYRQKHTHTHTHTHTRALMPAHTCTHTRTHTCNHVHTQSHSQAFAQTQCTMFVSSDEFDSCQFQRPWIS